MFDFLKQIPRNAWIAFGIFAFVVAFGSFFWGKSTGLEECKKV